MIVYAFSVPLAADKVFNVAIALSEMVAVIAPDVMASMAFACVTLVPSLTVIASVPLATTIAVPVTKASVTSCAVPVIVVILDAVTVPEVAPPIAFSTEAAVDPEPEIATVAVFATTFLFVSTNASFTSVTVPEIAIA